jgi:hypothetical protein
MIDGAWLLWLLLLIAAVGAGCFWAGWRSAATHLVAALDVSRITNATIDQANSFSSSLDKQQAEAASLRASIDHHTEITLDRQGRVEDAVRLLYTALEASGLVRTPGRAKGRQVGETGTEQG